MPIGLRYFAILFAAVTWQTPIAAQSRDDAFTHQRMTSAGFIPLEEMTFGGRDVRRVLPVDPYGMLPIPGVELERHHDGRFTLRLQHRGWTGPVHLLSQVEWDRLANLELSAFAPPGRNSFKAKPGVTVHCWSGMLEASPVKAAGWWGCNSGTSAAQAYTVAVLALAMEKAQCPAGDKDTLWGFSECFGKSGTLDDSLLQKRFTELGDQWEKQREPGSKILMNARQTLATARKEPTSLNLEIAREAVFSFGRQQQELSNILQMSYMIFSRTENTDAKRDTIIADRQRNWNADIQAQNGNYINLLEDLARLSANAESRLSAPSGN